MKEEVDFQQLLIKFMDKFNTPLTKEELEQIEKDDKSGKTDYLMNR